MDIRSMKLISGGKSDVIGRQRMRKIHGDAEIRPGQDRETSTSKRLEAVLVGEDRGFDPRHHADDGFGFALYIPDLGCRVLRLRLQ